MPESEALQTLIGKRSLGPPLVNVLAESQSDPQARWTVTHKETGAPREFDQYDYLLMPPDTAKKVTKAWVGRRSTTPSNPDGSDHDPVFCEVGL